MIWKDDFPWPPPTLADEESFFLQLPKGAINGVVAGSEIIGETVAAGHFAREMAIGDLTPQVLRDLFGCGEDLHQ